MLTMPHNILVLICFLSLMSVRYLNRKIHAGLSACQIRMETKWQDSYRR
jgi:hypothetical protein